MGRLTMERKITAEIYMENKAHTRRVYKIYVQIYCKICKKKTGNMFPKKLILISNYKIKGKSKCAICLTKRTFIHEIEGKYDLES